MIAKNWWKILSVILILYTLIAGFLVPLKPGIQKIDKSGKAYPDSTLELSITGYNTHFNEVSSLGAFLVLDTFYSINASKIETQSYNKISALFDIPSLAFDSLDYMPSDLYVFNEEDGAMILPEAVYIHSGADSASIDIDKLPLFQREDLFRKGGFRFPYRGGVLHETIRNTFFHVMLWMSMFVILLIGLFHSIMYLRTKDMSYDIKASSYNNVAILYGILGIITGSIWAKYTWGTYWTTDVKLNMTAIAMLIYCAYWILRSSIEDMDTRARVSAVYAIFAFVALIPLVLIIPRLTDSLHPGNGGNPALGGEDLDHTLRMVFYPSILGFTLLGIWLASLNIRLLNIKDRWEEIN